MIELFYLARIQDGLLTLTFYAEEVERDAAVMMHVVAVKQILGIPSDAQRSTIELEELYEHATGQQLELITGVAAVPLSHPALKAARGHISKAITTLDALTILSPLARSELAAALALLGEV